MRLAHAAFEVEHRDDRCCSFGGIHGAERITPGRTLTTCFVAAARAPTHRLHGRPDGERPAIRDRPATRLVKAENRHSARAQRREPSGRDPPFIRHPGTRTSRPTGLLNGGSLPPSRAATLRRTTPRRDWPPERTMRPAKRRAATHECRAAGAPLPTRRPHAFAAPQAAADASSTTQTALSAPFLAPIRPMC